MFKAIRISILLLILFVVVVNTFLTKARSTDWDNSLWVKVYPINGDGSDISARYIDSLTPDTFKSIEDFVAREIERYGHSLDAPVRLELGREIRDQPPYLSQQPGVAEIMWWSLKMRWWVNSSTSDQDDIEPDVSIFVRYHQPEGVQTLENSIGVQKGMYGIVNAFSGRRHAGRNNVVIAHEFFHTIGATDKYDMGDGQPLVPEGLAEPDRSPLYPQRYAEIMGGRIALADYDAVIPKSLKYVVIGRATAREINLVSE